MGGRRLDKRFLSRVGLVFKFLERRNSWVSDEKQARCPLEKYYLTVIK